MDGKKTIVGELSIIEEANILMDRYQKDVDDIEREYINQDGDFEKLATGYEKMAALVRHYAKVFEEFDEKVFSGGAQAQPDVEDEEK